MSVRAAAQLNGTVRGGNTPPPRLHSSSAGEWAGDSFLAGLTEVNLSKGVPVYVSWNVFKNVLGFLFTEVKAREKQQHQVDNTLYHLHLTAAL